MGRNRRSTPTQPASLMAAAYRLWLNGRGQPFTLSRLVLAAWNEDPCRFGLRHYESLHPDSNKIICHLCGPRGLVGRGLLRTVGERSYDLTPAGLEWARELEGAACDVH